VLRLVDGLRAGGRAIERLLSWADQHITRGVAVARARTGSAASAGAHGLVRAGGAGRRAAGRSRVVAVRAAGRARVDAVALGGAGRRAGRAGGSWARRHLRILAAMLRTAALTVAAAMAAVARAMWRPVRRVRIVVSSVVARALDGLEDRGAARADRRSVRRATVPKGATGAITIVGPTLASSLRAKASGRRRGDEPPRVTARSQRIVGLPGPGAATGSDAADDAAAGDPRTASPLRARAGGDVTVLGPRARVPRSAPVPAEARDAGESGVVAAPAGEEGPEAGVAPAPAGQDGADARVPAAPAGENGADAGTGGEAGDTGEADRSATPTDGRQRVGASRQRPPPSRRPAGRDDDARRRPLRFPLPLGAAATLDTVHHPLAPVPPPTSSHGPSVVVRRPFDPPPAADGGASPSPPPPPPMGGRPSTGPGDPPSDPPPAAGGAPAIPGGTTSAAGDVWGPPASRDRLDGPGAGFAALRPGRRGAAGPAHLARRVRRRVAEQTVGRRGGRDAARRPAHLAEPNRDAASGVPAEHGSGGHDVGDGERVVIVPAAAPTPRTSGPTPGAPIPGTTTPGPAIVDRSGVEAVPVPGAAQLTGRPVRFPREAILPPGIATVPGLAGTPDAGPSHPSGPAGTRRSVSRRSTRARRRAARPARASASTDRAWTAEDDDEDLARLRDLGPADTDLRAGGRPVKRRRRSGEIVRLPVPLTTRLFGAIKLLLFTAALGLVMGGIVVALVMTAASSLG